MALVESRFRDVAFYITVIAAYIGGVATFRRAELEWRENALNVVLAPIVTGFLIGSDLLTMRDAACRWIPAVMLSYAWGIINSGESFADCSSCFVTSFRCIKMCYIFQVLTLNSARAIFNQSEVRLQEILSSW